MNQFVPLSLGLIAGSGVYPRLVAESARKQGVERILAIAFKKETDPMIARYADEVRWIAVGQLGPMLDFFKRGGVNHAVMAGQITPTNLFRVRIDRPMLSVLKNLPRRNAETIFSAVANKLRAIGIELMPGSMFMESHMPAPGLLSKREATEREQKDIDIGIKTARTTSNLDIGQTVVIKQGTVLAVEAFEGTDETIKRAGRLGGPGTVVVKVAKQGHDMRFDIPVIGLRTMKLLKRVKAGVLAIEAGRSILLEREKIIEQADKMNICLTALEIP